MHRNLMAAGAVVAALLLAGCAEQGADPGNGDAPDPEGLPDPDGEPDGTTNATSQVYARAAPTVLNLTGAQRLVEEEAGVAKVTLNFGPGALVQGGDPTFIEGPHWPHDLLIRSVRIDGHVDTDTPAAGVPIESEIIVWIGVDGHLVTAIFADAPDVLAPGDAAPFSQEIPLARGLVVPEGSRLTLALGTLYTDDGSVRSTHVLTGPETGTWLTVESEWVELPPLEDPVEVLAETGELAGSTCVGTEMGTEHTAFTFEVPEGTAYLEAHIAPTGGVNGGNDDIDVRILDSVGDRVGGTAGPGGTESAYLWAPQVHSALAGTWTAQVHTCAMQQIEFEVQVLIAAAVQPTGAGDGPPAA